MAYVDGFLFAIPKTELDAYRQVIRLASELWKEKGALDYVECLADDVPYGELTSFPRAVMAKDDETVVFSWIVFESREARDRINKEVMDDKRMTDAMGDLNVDMKRMIYGGFTPLIGL